MIKQEILKKIYEKLGDDLSKEVFKNRLMYSISQDEKWVYENVRLANGGSEFLNKLDACAQNGEIVIWGAGVWGKDLYKVTKNYPWKCFIDSNPKAAEYNGVPIIAYDDFMANYSGEYIFISSRIYYKEMYKKILASGIDEDKIVNVGQILDRLASEQYFDLEYLEHAKGKEVFVDVGSFDGMTSVYFDKWSYGDSFVYAFEPDEQNQKKCQDNLENNHIQHKIVPKGAWDEETTLKFCAAANGTSSMNEVGNQSVDVDAIDHVLGDEPVTFIKMDIEGSELRALKGARNVITKNKPKLAISIYHKPEDIWELPQIILEYNPEYQLYLRHYSLTDFETVLYAIPM